MTWAKFSDDTPEDPNVSQLSDAAFRLWFDAHCHCARTLSDGVMTARDMAWVLNNRPPSLFDELGPTLWQANGSGGELVGYSDIQSTKAEILAGRERAAARQAKQRRHKTGDHSGCEARYCSAIRDGWKADPSRVTSRPPKPSLAEPSRSEARGLAVGEGPTPTPTSAGAPSGSDAGHTICVEVTRTDGVWEVSVDAYHPDREMGESELAQFTARKAAIETAIVAQTGRIFELRGEIYPEDDPTLSTLIMMSAKSHASEVANSISQSLHLAGFTVTRKKVADHA